MGTVPFVRASTGGCMAQLVPLSCAGCGAPIPLADGDGTMCFSCGHVMTIPEAYRALRRESGAARAVREAAETRCREIIARSVPGWVPSLYLAVVLAAVAGVPILFALARRSWSPREWVVLAGLLPFAISFYPWIELYAASRPWIHLHALGRRLRPRPPAMHRAGLSCGACGAPLAIDPEALAATCDYCHADSWLTGVGPAHDPERARTDRHRQNLSALIAAADFERLDLRTLRAVYPLVWGIVLCVLWLMMPDKWHP